MPIANAIGIIFLFLELLKQSQKKELFPEYKVKI
jgi:hypothetical protein